jgi:hypothetical protein
MATTMIFSEDVTQNGAVSTLGVTKEYVWGHSIYAVPNLTARDPADCLLLHVVER